ncbi:transmembrane protein [Pasteurella multocida]|nr:transmembrane protein [Pasteurella multocida]
MGITNMLFFIIVGQLIAAMVIDHYGLIHMPVREVNLFKFIGIAIVGIGLIIFFFGDKFMKLFSITLLCKHSVVIVKAVLLFNLLT